MPPSHTPARKPRPWAALLALLCLNLIFVGAGIVAFRPTPTGAQGELSADQQATLDAVRALLAAPSELTVQQRPDGSYFADLRGQLQAVLLAATNAQGEAVTRCVSTLEQAAAFLAEAPTLAGAATFAPEGGASAVRKAVEGDPALLAAALAATQTSIRVLVTDDPGEGFNDPTPATPIAGNTGTTVGQQRLQAFEYAAGIWAAFLQSTVPIKIEARFDPLQCSAGGGVLGSAGPQTIHRNFAGTPNSFFPGAEKPNTWYVQALANQRAGADIGGIDSSSGQAIPDIFAQFNSNVGQPNCIAGSGWYYGFDGNQGGKIDLVVVLLHEFGHGLGFLSLVNLTSGPGNPVGANFGGFPDIWNSYVVGKVDGVEKLWLNMTIAERGTSITSGNLAWNGASVTAGAAQLYGTSAPRLSVSAATPVSPISGTSASFGPLISEAVLSAALVAAVDLDEDGAGTRYSSRDACSPLTNAAAASGKLLLVERGPCAYSAQARSAQAAGAVAIVIADNLSVSAPPELSGADSEVSIPAIGITQSAGATLRSRLADGPVSGSLALVRNARPGTDSLGRAKLYAPATVEPGSSVSHFDTAATGPNLLMEPSINSDLSASLDLTDDLMRDIGWLPDLNYNGLDDRKEYSLSVAQSARALFILPSQPVTLTITARNQGYTAIAATLASSLPAGLTGIAWTASYSGGATGPISGTGTLSAALILPADSAVVFTVSAQAPAQLGDLGVSQASVTRLAGGGLSDSSGTADDSAALTLRVVAQLQALYLPILKR